MSPAAVICGELYVFVAFDWGDEIDLDQARRLVPSSDLALARRRRTPSSFFFKPAPLHVPLEPVALELTEIGTVTAAASATLFDFAAVSLALRVPVQLDADALLRLAASLAEPTPIVQRAGKALQPLYRQMLPAIRAAAWHEELSEEYFVLHLQPEGGNEEMLTKRSAWLAGLVHLEGGPLSQDEINEALKMRLSYGTEDHFVPDWAAAVLIDRDCDETLQVIEFANLQLLEFRNIDNRLDDSLAAAARSVHSSNRSLAFWRLHLRPLRELGELKVEANTLFERTGNVLKLVGDPYLARVYRLLAARFHLETWEESIRRNLETAEGVYRVAFDMASTFRAEFLEAVVVVLILIEIVLAFVRH